MAGLRVLWTTLRADQKGVTALEYGLLAAVVAVVMVAGASQLGVGLKDLFSTISTSLS